MTALNGLVPDLPEEVYHAHPALSSTGARRILESPARFRYLQDHPEPPRLVFDVGTAAHTKILGVGAGVIAYPEEHLTPGGNVSTKAATVAWAAEQRAAGLTPVTPDTINAVDAMAEAVLAHPEARRILESAEHREMSLFATDPETGVELRARFDVYGDEECADVKTAPDASPNGFMKAVWNHRYDIQEEHYLKVRELIIHDRPRFAFLAVEKTPPYLVGVYTLNDQWQEIGDVWATAARRTFRACTDANLWPGYSTEIQELVPPMGLIYDHQDRFATREMVL